MEPPDYDLSKIHTVPLALFCGLGDQLSSPGDFRWAKEELTNANVVFYKEYEKCGHMYFLVPAHPRTHFKEMMDLMKEHN